MKLYKSTFPCSYDGKCHSYPWYFSDLWMFFVSCIITATFMFILIKVIL